MDEQRLAEIEARVNAASPAPWWYDGWYSVVFGPRPEVVDSWNYDVNRRVFDDGSAGDEYGQVIDMEGPDAAFIMQARTDVPDLIAEIRRLQGALNAQAQ